MRVASLVLVAWGAVALAMLGCGRSGAVRPLEVDGPLRLAEHLASATLYGSAVPARGGEALEWDFSEPRPEWHLLRSGSRASRSRTDDGLRLELGDPGTSSPGPAVGGIWIDLPLGQERGWGWVMIRARALGPVESVGLAFGRRGDPADSDDRPFRVDGERIAVETDGRVHVYSLRADWARGTWDGEIQRLGIVASSRGPGALEVLSVALVPRRENYSASLAGATVETRGAQQRRTLYLHAPGRIDFRIRVPEAGRLDAGLGVLETDVPVSFRVSATLVDGRRETLLEETWSDPGIWAQRSVDLGELAGETVTLSLEADSERPDALALWGSPTVSGRRSPAEPNVIVYVVGGATAEAVSLYGYNRTTTPHFERLAAQGVAFDRAYATSIRSRPAVLSLMTSLHPVALGGGPGTERVPARAPTLGELLRSAGYQAAVFTSEPEAGIGVGLDRGADLLDEVRRPSVRSADELLSRFLDWRLDYPGEPYLARIHSGSLQSPRPAPPPHAGTWAHPGSRFRDHYDEALAYQDAVLGRLVHALKASGEWDRTVLVVAADRGSSHLGEVGRGHGGSSSADDGASGGATPGWTPDPPTSLLSPDRIRVPLLFVWPGKLPAGRRVQQPVSTVDVLPTVLDLVGLELPRAIHGRSLRPLLSGVGDEVSRPVMVEDVRGRLPEGHRAGSIGMIEGRWGAVLTIDAAESPAADESVERLLSLCDTWVDPYCRVDLTGARPAQAEELAGRLRALWSEHVRLAADLEGTEELAATPLTPEQIRTLRALGYIQ